MISALHESWFLPLTFLWQLFCFQGYNSSKYYGRWRGDGAAGEKIKGKMRCNVQGAKEKEKIASEMG